MKKRCLYTSLILFILILLSANRVFGDEQPQKRPTTPKDCLDCHEGVWDKASTKRFIHEPFQKKKCIVCHAADTPLGTEEPPTDEPSSDEVNWTGKSLIPATSHWLEFSSKGNNAKMILEATYGSRVRLYREIPIPPLDYLSDMGEIYEAPPNIKNVKVLAVEQGVFLTSTISWETARPTTATIQYGTGEKLDNIWINERLQTSHRETLSNLSKDKIYRFKIIAEDPVGNQAESDLFEFRTDKTFSASNPNDLSVKCCLAAPLGLESRFFRRGDKYLVNVTLARPVKLFFKVEEPGDSKTILADGDGAEIRKTENIKHIVVNEKKIIGLIICKKCHKNLRGHHPVNVFPKNGMEIPADYPTLDDGRVSCISCHTPHASDLQFQVIKNYRQELCIGCHYRKYAPAPNGPSRGRFEGLVGGKLAPTITADGP